MAVGGGGVSGGADPNATSAWNGLISGRKKWIFYPPHVTPPGVFPSADHSEVVAPVSVTDWLLTYYKPGHAQSVGGYECVQRPGDLVFIPSCWCVQLRPSRPLLRVSSLDSLCCVRSLVLFCV
jgi:hypothetical protein